MRVPLGPVALALIGILLSGCLQGTVPPAGPASETSGVSGERVLAVLNEVPPLDAFDRTAAVDRWERFVYENPKRDWRLPHNELAANFLHAELAAAGYEAEILTLPVKSQFLTAGPASLALDGPAKIVRGTRLGASPDHRFALVAHYDTVTATTMGAYDDASGTMIQLELCKAIAKVQTNHTIDCLFFDAEEEGLLASRAYVDAYQKGRLGVFTYDLVFGFDMTGINWPGYAPWPLTVMIGTQSRNHPDLDDLTDPFHSFLDIALGTFVDGRVQPGARAGVSILDLYDRNSDEKVFRDAGIPIIRFTGGRHANDYPQYHGPLDTPAYVYQFAGGKENFARGYEFSIQAAYYAILGMDGFDPWTLESAVPPTF